VIARLLERTHQRDHLVTSVERLAHDGAAVAAWDVTTAKGKSRIAISPVLTLSSMLMVRDAVRAGAGAAQLPLSLISRVVPVVPEGRLSKGNAG